MTTRKARLPASTNQFLDAIARNNPAQDGSPASDYRLHQILGVTKQAISKYRLGQTAPDDAVAIRIAALLDLPPEYVVACIHQERARVAEEKSLWRSIAEKFAGLAAAALLALTLLLPPPPAQAAAATQHVTAEMRMSFDNNTDYAQLTTRI